MRALLASIAVAAVLPCTLARHGSSVDRAALEKRAQSCSVTADCSNTPPTNANRYCSGGTCTWRCRSGFTSTGSACVQTGSATTTNVAAVAIQTCKATSDCSNTIPTNANRYCASGTCSFRCQSGYALSGSSCVAPGSSSTASSKTSSTSSATTSSAAVATSTGCKATSDCQNSYPANSHRYCASGVCTFPTSPAATPKLKKTYSGSTFFDSFYFLNSTDPTNGMVNYVNSDYAFANNLASISSDNTVLLSIDRNSTLAAGTYRPSVRIQSYDTYNPGNLLIFDVKHVPVGCGSWPAIWMFNYPWPDYGEIDIYEGVNNRAFNQMTLHTSNGCTRNPNIPQSGSVDAAWASNNCYAYSSTYGCQVMDWDPKSYGAGFNAAGGGVWAVMFAETGISMWRWTRSAIPSDVTKGAPRWKTWGTPVAAFDGSTCDTRTFFQQQMITLDITTCGDWAGLDSVWQDSLQSGSTCYPKYKNCGAAVQDPAAFSEAYFEINAIKGKTI
ncbi:hypothetical protein JCM11641_002856 [Rhodosporidiobolus odoratus]